MSPTGRRLQVLALLQARPGASASFLAERFSTTTRTIRRDIERLRELGYPVEGSPGRSGGYRLARGHTAPPLVLDDDEALATGLGLRMAVGAGVEGLGDAAVTALAKLEEGLPSRVRARLAAAGGVDVAGRGGRPGVATGVLTTCALACRAGEGLRLRYRSEEADRTQDDLHARYRSAEADGARARGRGRDVQPHRLVQLSGRWYLVAYDVAAGRWQTLRLDRMDAVAPAGTRWATAPPPADPAAFVVEAVATGGWGQRVEVRLFVDVETAATLVPPTLGTLHPEPDGCRLLIGTEDLDWAARRVVALGLDFEVVGPAAFADALADLGAWVRDVARAARADGAVEVRTGDASHR